MIVIERYQYCAYAISIGMPEENQTPFVFHVHVVVTLNSACACDCIRECFMYLGRRFTIQSACGWVEYRSKVCMRRDVISEYVLLSETLEVFSERIILPARCHDFVRIDQSPSDVHFPLHCTEITVGSTNTNVYLIPTNDMHF